MAWPLLAPAAADPAPGSSSARATATDASTACAKELKRRGWTFVGPTTVYAFMQAMGLVNDHIEGCHVRAKALKARAKLKSPT